MTDTAPNLAVVVANEQPTSPVQSITTLTGSPAIVASTATPTQVANPTRTTYRSALQLILALVVALPQIIPIVTGAWSPEWLVTAGAQVLLVQVVIVRVMALPGVDGWLQDNLPWLSALRTKAVAQD